MRKLKAGMLRGSGGGDSAPEQHVPVESPDNLQSSASAQIADLLSEGEIEGLVNGLQSIFLNETALQNPDGTFNFTDVVVETRNGTQDQDYIPIGKASSTSSGGVFNGVTDVENEINVGTFVTFAIPIVRSISNVNVTAARVLLSIPQLSYSNPSSGDLGGSSVQFKISVQSNGGGYVDQITDTVTGKSMSKYQRSYRVQLTGGAPYDIKVTRLSADATDVTAGHTDSNTQNKTYWESFTEIVESRLTYPNSAIVAMRIKASQFQSVPGRAYDVKLLRIQIPTNYDPVTRVYTGTWDGTFQVAWSDNPAWVLYDLLTSTRYGLGTFISADNVDKWTLYTIARYCDELVPDGFGGTEPRFTCNIFLQTRNEAFRVINDLCSVFRGMPYWAAGEITVAQDSPQDANYLFSPANVIEGIFNYVGVSQKSRHTVCLVTWNDPTDFYRQKVEYVEDPEGIASYGIIEIQITAMGCTSRGQAHRLGQWTLYTEKYQSETVSFQTGLEGAICRPGQVIKIADPVRAGVRCGGRISAATVSTITTDADIPISFDSNMSVAVNLPDGTTEERTVSSIAGRVITVLTEFSAAPQVAAIWMLSNADVEPQFFRVVNVSESKPGVFDVTAIAHNPSKFDAIDNGTILEVKDISLLTEIPASPTNLQVIETLYAVGRDVRDKVTLTWNQVAHAASYVVQWKRDSLNSVSGQEQTANDFEIFAAEPGTYQFWVYAISPIGKRSVPAQITKEVLGKTAIPEDVQNFSLIPQAGMAYLSWDLAADLDVIIGGSVRVRWSPDILSPTWSSAVDISPTLPGTATKAQVPLMAGSYMAKFVDSSGISSETEALIETTVPEALAINQIEVLTEEPTFIGTFDDMEFRGDFAGITLTSTTQFDDLPDVDLIDSLDFVAGMVSAGEYQFDNSLDLGAVYTSRMTAALTVIGLDITELIDQRLDDMDTWTDLDSDLTDDVNVVLYVRTTEDDPGAAPTWTAWKPFFVGEYRARAMQFKIIATSESPSHTPLVTGLSVTIDMPDRVVNMSSLVSGAGLYHVTFEDPFHAAPTIGITGLGMNSGDYFTIANKTESGFDITFKNSSNAAVSRTFDVLAKGYGRRVA